MKTLLNTAFLCLLLGLPASAQSGSIMSSDNLTNVRALLKGTWITAAPDHLGGREVMVVLENELGIGYVDKYETVDVSYEGSYKIDRNCNGTRAEGIYIVTQREDDPCWEIINLDLSKLEFRDKARYVTTKFVLQSR